MCFVMKATIRQHKPSLTPLTAYKITALYAAWLGKHRYFVTTTTNHNLIERCYRRPFHYIYMFHFKLFAFNVPHKQRKRIKLRPHSRASSIKSIIWKWWWWLQQQVKKWSWAFYVNARRMFWANGIQFDRICLVAARTIIIIFAHIISSRIFARCMWVSERCV